MLKLSKKVTHKRAVKGFDNFVECVNGVEGYKAFGAYVNSKTKIGMVCEKGHTYSVKPNDFKQGYRCPRCAGKCPIKSKEDFIKSVEDSNYTLIGTYVKAFTKVGRVCDKGHSYETTPHNFKRGYRCPRCAKSCPIKAREAFIKLVEDSNYTLIGEYVATNTHLNIQCEKGHEYSVTPNNFNSGHRCPFCEKRSSDNDVVYLWRVPNTNIYKIGTTSERLGDRRVKLVSKANNVDYQILGMYRVENATTIEYELLNTYKITPTTLPNKFADGYTEFRVLTESDVNEITYYLEKIVGEKIC